MGGNTRAIDRKTGEVLAYAEKVDLRIVPRQDLVDTVYSALSVIDELHLIEFGDSLWQKDVIGKLLGGAAFNGSSEHVMNARVSLGELLKHKPVMGDIDVTVPHERLKTLFSLLESLSPKEPLPEFSYLGQNKSDQNGHQINALFRYAWGKKREHSVNVQVDFEGTDYGPDGMPTPFSKFAHSSSWDDIKLGLKGVGHKYWLINLVRAVSENTKLVQLTDKSPMPPLPVRLKKVAPGEHPRTHAFSVDRGLRYKMKMVKHNGKLLRIDGKIAVQERLTSESEYIRDLPTIFTFLFGHTAGPGELKKMWSLSGLIDLCEKYVSEDKLESAYLFMLKENIFGPNAQKLDRASAEVDEQAKMKIVNYLKKRMPYLKDFDNELVRLKAAYYGRY